MEKKPKPKSDKRQREVTTDKKRKIKWNFAKGKIRVIDPSFIDEDEKL